MKPTTIIALILGIALWSHSNAQVLIPDLNTRDALNTIIPGIVDGAGIMDTLNPAIPDLDSAWVTVVTDNGLIDLFGLQFLNSLEVLYVSGLMTGSQPLTLTAERFPASLDRLLLHIEAGAMNVGQLPDSMQSLTFSGLVWAPSLTVLDMPEHINSLTLGNLGEISWNGSVRAEQLYINTNMLQQGSINVPPIDVGQILVSDYWGWGNVDFSQASAESLVMTSVLMEDLILPSGLMTLDLDLSLLQSFCLPLLPESLSELRLANFSGCLPNWPSSLQWYTGQFGDITYGNNANYCSVLNSTCAGAYPGIAGRVFADTNGNGSFDLDEPGLPQASVTLQPNGNVVGCQANGTWEMGVAPGTYSITAGSSYPYAQSITPAEHAADVLELGTTDVDNDFAVHLTPDIADLRVWLWAEPARPGFDNRLNLTCQNYGTIPLDAELTLNYDGDQTWVGSSIAPASSTATSATWTFPAMAIGASATVTVDLNTATSVALGTPIEHLLVASSSQTDETPGDNVYTLTDSVVGSYDPNDKLLSPAVLSPAQVQAGETPIEYTIRFQNTGTYLAERVVILDTLSEDLQWESMRFLDSSHPNHWYVVDGVLHVIHNDINLPDSSSDEANSHGFVRFSILPSTDLADGATITNIAHIVFDFNEPIITPPAVFMFDITSGVERAERGPELSILPNPAHDRILVRVPSGTALPFQIKDLLGHSVAEGILPAGNCLDIGTLATGTYILVIEDQDLSTFTRFVKL